LTLTGAVEEFYRTREPWGEAVRSRRLQEAADHFFTGRQLRLRGPDEAAQWGTVARTIGVEPDRLVQLTQVHGRDVVIVRRDSTDPLPAVPPRADIVVTDDPSVAVAVQVADCVPLLIADARTGAVAAVHAGWRGTLRAAGPAGVRALEQAFGSRPDDLVVAHGPSIGPCCYEVGPEVRESFLSDGFGATAERWFAPGLGDRLLLDLWTANRDQLVAAGVRPDRIHQSRLCTACRPGEFHSYRRDGKGTGRIAAVIRAPGRPSPGIRLG